MGNYLADDKIASYVRVYDPSIKMYGRGGKGLWKKSCKMKGSINSLWQKYR